MSDGDSQQISLLLADWSRGDERALEQLMPLVYDELRRMARGYMSRQPANHTFQTTELIHEAYLKLAKNGGRDFQNRKHFFGVAAKAMRHILVDYARAKQSDKRSGVRERVPLADEASILCGAKLPPSIVSASPRRIHMTLGPASGPLGKKRLVIIPDGALQFIPFAMLPDPVGKDEPGSATYSRPLIVGHEDITQPSASAIAVQRTELGSRQPAPKTLAVIADPVFDRSDSRPDFLQRLEYSDHLLVKPPPTRADGPL